MAETRRTFRFRMPWLPVAQDLRPTVEQTPAQPTPTPPTEPTTTAPAQRPSFRPPGLAPAQLPPQAQTSTRTEPPTPSPSRANTQSQVASQPQSPSRATQSRVASQPPPPPGVAPQPQADSQPSSSTPPTASQIQPVPQPQSPSRPVSQAQPTERALNRPSSPSEKLQLTAQEGSQPPPGSTKPPPSVFQQEPRPSVSQPESQEPRPRTRTTSDNVVNSQNQTSIQTNFSANGTATQLSQVSGPTAAPAPTQKENSYVSAEPKSLPESNEKPGKTEEGKEFVQELTKEGKTNGAAYEEPKQRTVTEVLTVASTAKEQPSFTFQAKQKQVEKREILGTKETLPTLGSNGKQPRTMVPHLKDKNTLSKSHPKPDTSNGERAPLHKEIREDISKLVQKMASGKPNDSMGDKPVSVITLAGENRGASMQLNSESAKREGTIRIHRGYKSNPDESAEATTDREENSKKRRSKDPNSNEDEARKAYINNNIQSMNNSIVFNSSVTERNPGVHLVLSRKPIEPMIKSNKGTESETRKAEFSITPSRKLTYKPIIKRRCLRGLFMESSDSDPDNPEKPRRHGCRYGCMEKTKDTKIDVL